MVKVIFTLCIFISYGLQFYVPLEIVSPTLAETRISQLLGRRVFNYLFRTACVVITCECYPVVT